MIKIEPLENHPELVPLCACWNFEEWGQAVGRTLQETIDGFEPFLNPAGQQKAFIGFDNDLPAGLVLLIDNDLESHPHLKPWLASLFVVPEMRGKGIGTALIHAVENAARDQRHAALYLYTGKANYYRNLDWQDHEELSGDYNGLMILIRKL
jgi:GNAT superfamily N-acetyltransferase